MATMIYEDLEGLEIRGEEVLFWSSPFVTKMDRALPIYATLVRRGEQMRIDKVCQRLYGDIIYAEELMLLNGILNPFSIREGMAMLYATPNGMASIKDFDRLGEASRRESIRSGNTQGFDGGTGPIGSGGGGRGISLDADRKRITMR